MPIDCASDLRSPRRLWHARRCLLCHGRDDPRARIASSCGRGDPDWLHDGCCAKSSLALAMCLRSGCSHVPGLYMRHVTAGPLEPIPMSLQWPKVFLVNLAW